MELKIISEVVIFSFAIDLSRVSKREGSRSKFESIANKRVPETSAPKATVPPKFETIKTEKPKKRTIEV